MESHQAKNHAGATGASYDGTSMPPPPEAIDHVYVPLTFPTEIRIVVIAPAMDYDAPLQFSFIQAPLEAVECCYEALSYVWGPTISKHPVYHNNDGSRIYVTENLNDALRRLRHRLDPKWLWADAICIDQKNDREKEVQIPLMVKIYRGAKRVLAWLHKRDEELEQAMVNVDRLSRRLSDNDRRPELRKKKEKPRSNKHRQPGPSERKKIRRSKKSTRPENEELGLLKKELRTILSLRYFRRLWIVQEVVLSLEVVLICGETELSWPRVATTLRSIKEIQERTASQSLAHDFDIQHEAADLWFDNCVHSTPAPAKHIFDLAAEYSAYQCTDPRDRIYAIHALSKGNNAGTEVDYTLDACETFCRFARNCIVEGRIMDVFNAAILRRHVPSTIKVPSWVPDWTRKPKRSLAYREDRFKLLNENLFEVGIDDDPYSQEGVLQINIACINWFDANLGTEALVPNSWVVYTDPMSLELGFSAKPSAAFDLFLETDQYGTRSSGSWFACCVNIWREISGTTNPIVHMSEMHAICNASADCSEEAQKDSHMIEESQADLTNGYCVFGARSPNDNTDYFCYAPPGVLKGDRLVLVECLQKLYAILDEMQTYRAFVFRYEETVTTSDAKHGDVEGPKELTRLVGEAFLVWERRLVGRGEFHGWEDPGLTEV